MRSLLVLALTFASGVVMAQNQMLTTETRTLEGSRQVVSVGNSCSPAAKVSRMVDRSSLADMVSSFSFTACVEKITFQVKVEKDDKMSWNAKVTEIPNTRISTFEQQTLTKVTEEMVNAADQMQEFRVRNTCEQIRQAYRENTVAVSQTGCAGR